MELTRPEDVSDASSCLLSWGLQQQRYAYSNQGIVSISRGPFLDFRSARTLLHLGFILGHPVLCKLPCNMCVSRGMGPKA